MTRCSASAARLSIVEDQSCHSSSSVTTSRITLLSTSVATLLAPRQFHDLVGPHTRLRCTAHACNERFPPLTSAPGFADPNGIAIHFKFHLGKRQEAELLAYVLRNRHLSFGCNAHGILLLVRVILKWLVVKSIAVASR